MREREREVVCERESKTERDRKILHKVRKRERPRYMIDTER